MAIDGSIYHLQLGWYIRGQGVELLVNGNDYRTGIGWEGHRTDWGKEGIAKQFWTVSMR